ncbi:DUF3869 domain-containing protein [uncultured Bacteroides sp.]|uniref:DUF3869 domain-containing protein n=1 Tax=uncultured Bacteroides sp. TaxID=162156 RepID=UPI002AA7D1A6|nr:DUF3869 domain-containing protein [uncultured Bacteroides sp.]
MKMKSNVFGFSAKIALSVLAVCGTMFTSCYEKEDVDVNTTEPIPAAYYVVGSITDGSNGQPITTAVVTIDGVSVTLNNGAFSQKTTASGAHTVAVTAEGYYDMTKTVYCVEVADGQTSVAVADIALFTPGSQASDPIEDPTIPSTSDIEAVKSVISEAFTPTANPSGAVAGTSTTTVNDDGTVAIATPYTLDNSSTDAIEVSYVYNEGFELANEPATRAVSARDQFIANVAKQLNKSYGLTKVTKKTTLYEGGNSIIGYTVIYTIAIEEYIFYISGANWAGMATWQSNVQISAITDTHDSHDSHDGHGGSTNAGGGSGTSE